MANFRHYISYKNIFLFPLNQAHLISYLFNNKQEVSGALALFYFFYRPDQQWPKIWKESLAGMTEEPE
jgi:hypothetical protein